MGAYPEVLRVQGCQRETRAASVSSPEDESTPCLPQAVPAAVFARPDSRSKGTADRGSEEDEERAKWRDRGTAM
jgi:hypothetical protein